MRKCIHCHEDIKGYGIKFCSQSCNAIYNNIKFPKRHKTKVCSECSILVASTAITCGPVCVAKRRRRLRLEREATIEVKTTQGISFCSKCRQDKPSDNFYIKANGKRGSWCTTYISKAHTQRNYAWKLEAIEYKGGKCEKCGYNTCLAALDFHHINDKLFAISKKKTSLKELKQELDKCELLCANCHREEHDRLHRIET